MVAVHLFSLVADDAPISSESLACFDYARVHRIRFSEKPSPRAKGAHLLDAAMRARVPGADLVWFIDDDVRFAGFACGQPATRFSEHAGLQPEQSGVGDVHAERDQPRHTVC